MIGERMMKSDAGAVPTYRRTGNQQLKPQGLQGFMALRVRRASVRVVARASSSWVNVFDGFDW